MKKYFPQGEESTNVSGTGKFIFKVATYLVMKTTFRHIAMVPICYLEFLSWGFVSFFNYKSKTLVVKFSNSTEGIQ